MRTDKVKKSVVEAIYDGANRSVEKIRFEQLEQDLILVCRALDEAKVDDSEIERLIAKYWDLRPSEANYYLQVSKKG